MTLTCKTCRHFNYKTQHVNGTCWGECLSPAVQGSQHVAYQPGPNFHGQIELLLQDVQAHARIYYREDTFGCRFYEREETS